MGQTTIHVACIDQRLTAISSPRIASGGKNENVIEFEFCPLWDGFSKTAIFYRDMDTVFHVALADNCCHIPSEVLADKGAVYFGVFGVKDDITRTSEVLRYQVVQGALTEGTEPADPTPELYEQILGQLSALNERLTHSPFEVTGGVVQVENYNGMPMNCVTRIEPVQEGGGDPSPDNVRSIKGFTGAKLARTGKNLINVPAKEQTGAGYVCNKYKLGVPILPGTYTFSCKHNITSGVGWWVRFENAAGEKIGDTGTLFKSSSGATIEITGIAVSISIYVNGAVSMSDIQLEAGSVATAYEPYQGEAFTAEFGQTVCAGEIDWNTGVLTVDRKLLTFTGNEVWAASSQTNAYYVGSVSNPNLGIYNILTANSGASHTHDCSHYKEARYATPMANNTVDIFAGTAGNTIRFRDDRCTSLDAWVTYVKDQYAAGTPVQVACVLTRPATIQLTPAQITAIQGTNYIWSDVGETTVSGRKDFLWLTEGLLQRIQTLEATLATLEAAALSE